MKKNGPKTHDDEDGPTQVEKPPLELVRVRALRYHTAFGNEYHEGDEYDAPADQLINLLVQRFAARVEPPAE